MVRLRRPVKKIIDQERKEIAKSFELKTQVFCVALRARVVEK